MKNQDALKNDVSTHFEFGENWAAYSELISEERIAKAEEGLSRLVPADELAGRHFLDIGCGSGLHSLAALNLGAASVTAVDIDPVSAETAKKTVAKFAPNKSFDCQTGSVFDLPFEAERKFDIVYSWGVLHHTGSMWEAIANAIDRVAPNGKLVIAIYLKTPFCGFWKVEKKVFTSLPKLLRYPVIWLYCALSFLRILAKGRNPVSYIREYARHRGMSWYRDRIDWLGGYPYESASADEIVEFVEQRGGRLLRSFDTKPSFGLFGSGCAEYVFEFGE